MKLKSITTYGLSLALLSAASGFAQSGSTPPEQTKIIQGEQPSTQKVVVVTGARFSYKLVEKWIDDYNKVNPHVQIIVESRGFADPLKYDILAEVYEHDDELKNTREYIHVGRYAVLPVANSASSFANIYGERGLNADLIKQIFFHDIFTERSKNKTIDAPYTVYTRLQKAGVPAIFSAYFGHQQKDLKGTSIAGADAHLLKAVLRDSTGVTYLPLPLIYDEETRRPVEGLAVLPVDLNGNKKITEDERFYDTIDRVLQVFDAQAPGKINNIPIDYLHLSVDKTRASAEAIDFLKWVNENGQEYLHKFGYLKPEARYSEKEKFNEFASAQGR
jgi:ABC-type phosphate transport system substrate-binding protein